MNTFHITITEHAAHKFTSIIDSSVLKNKTIDNYDKNTTFIRLEIKGGGCSGFQYLFNVVTEKKSEDFSFSFGNHSLIVDPNSIILINHSKIDYVSDLLGDSFRIINPQASSSCGCGTSFSL